MFFLDASAVLIIFCYKNQSPNCTATAESDNQSVNNYQRSLYHYRFPISAPQQGQQANGLASRLIPMCEFLVFIQPQLLHLSWLCAGYLVFRIRSHLAFNLLVGALSIADLKPSLLLLSASRIFSSSMSLKIYISSVILVSPSSGQQPLCLQFWKTLCANTHRSNVQSTNRHTCLQ